MFALATQLLGIGMGKLKTTRWDSAEHLRSDEEIAAYMEAALEQGDPVLIAHALGTAARCAQNGGPVADEVRP